MIQDMRAYTKWWIAHPWHVTKDMAVPPDCDCDYCRDKRRKPEGGARMTTPCKGCKRETAMTTPDGFCPSCDWEDRQGIVAWRKAYAAKKGRAR